MYPHCEHCKDHLPPVPCLDEHGRDLIDAQPLAGQWFDEAQNRQKAPDHPVWH
jgi:hypothetical protein